MLQQLSELQQQKQDVVGEAQQMNLKCDNTQKEVHIIKNITLTIDFQ